MFVDKLTMATACVRTQSPAARHNAPAGFFHAPKPPNVPALVAETANPIPDRPWATSVQPGVQAVLEVARGSDEIGTTVIPAKPAPYMQKPLEHRRY